METAYLVCAVIGGTLLVIQTLLLVIAGADADADLEFDDAADAVGVDTDFDHAPGDAPDPGHDAAHDSFLKILSLKTVVAFLTFFGLTGLASLRGELSSSLTLVLSVGAGLTAVYIIAWMMSSLAKLQSRGNLDLQNAVGSTARVYLRIPAAKSGVGKVSLAVQGRRVECKAVTEGAEIATGTQVRVVGLSGTDTLEVGP